MKGPSAIAHPSLELALPILIRDQYGDLVASPSLKVEVVVQKMDDSSSRLSRACSSEAYRINVPEQSFQPTVKDSMRFNSISMMKGFTGFSFEELRLASGAWGEAVQAATNRIPAERLVIKPQHDGSYNVNWTPKVAGVYAFRCTLDDLPIAQELLVDVTDSVIDDASDCGVQTTQPPSPPTKIRRFNMEQSAGLRVRASPSLQAEELGRVPPGENVAFVEEVSNKDGTWVRLSVDSIRAFTDGTAPVAWCLAHHCHLDRVLLEAIDPESPEELQEMDYAGPWTRYDKTDGVESPPPPPAPAPPLPAGVLAGDEVEAGPSNDSLLNDDSSFPFSSDCDMEDADSGPSHFGYTPEPCKRDRQMRNEAGASAASSPRRRNNGNDWWEPVRHRPDNGPDNDDGPHFVAMPIPAPKVLPPSARPLYDVFCDVTKSGAIHQNLPPGYYRPMCQPVAAEKPYTPIRRLPADSRVSPEPPSSQRPDLVELNRVHEAHPPREPSPSHKDSPLIEVPPELQPKLKNRDLQRVVSGPSASTPRHESRVDPRPEPRVDSTVIRQPDPQDSPRREIRDAPPPPALRDHKPPVNREQKPELPHRERAMQIWKPPPLLSKDEIVESSPARRKPGEPQTAFREKKIAPLREQSDPPTTPHREPKTRSIQPESKPTPPREKCEQNTEQTAKQSESESCSAARVAAGTQTSPESTLDLGEFYLNLARRARPAGGPASPLADPLALIVSNGNMNAVELKETCGSPRSIARERTVSRERLAARTRKRTYTSPPPPLPARTAPVLQLPKKHALSPAQAECLRAIFAALLWHEGIVHDAIACAAFLKFHPQLPKQGTRVVTRPPHDVTPTRHQRHSVEVSNAGHYLRIHPTTLETLTRSGVEASASRARKAELSDTIREEDSHNVNEPGPSSTPAVVNVLPPALRALVALWDALYDADQLSAATDKYKKPIPEIQDVDEPKVVDPKLVRGAIPKKVEWKAGLISYKASYSVRCELCGGASVPPPLAAHMRHLHPGCRTPSMRGYDRAGIYKRAEPRPAPAPTDLPPSTCGQLAQDMSPVSSLWYVYCERCRDKTIKAASAKQSKRKASVNSNEGVELTTTVDHHIMKENAVFLLDLAPLTNSESISTSPWRDGCTRSPPTPPGSVWQPAPPFQCLPALGAAPRANTTVDAARYHSLGRPAPPPVAPIVPQYGGLEGVGSHQLRVHRSVSMGQAGGRDLAGAARHPLTNILQEDQSDTLSSAGSSLLAQPSAQLQRLVGCGDPSAGCGLSAFEPPRVDPEILMKSPVLSFVRAKRDLPVYRQKMDAAVRINTVRQYAFEAMNWFLRSTTQPTCVHDVMWWFCTALDKYARLVPPTNVQDDNKENASNDSNRPTVPTASTAAICPGGRAARGARSAFHAFLGSVSALAPSLSPASAASLQAVRCWALHYSKEDRAFLQRSQVFNVISKILSHSEDFVYDDDIAVFHHSLQSFLNKDHFVWACADVTPWCDISVSSRQGMAGSLVDGSTETFWESGDEDRNKAKWIQVAFAGGMEDRPHIICVHLDNTRDTSNKTLLVSFLYSGSSGEMFHMQDMEVDPKAATWMCYTLPTCFPGVNSGSLRVRCELRGPEPAVRVRQVRVLSVPTPQARPAPPPARVLHALAEADTLRVFRLLTSEVFGKLLEWDRSGSESMEGPSLDDAPADDSDLREHVVGILFAGHQLTSLQREVMTHIVSAIGAEAARVRDDWETSLLLVEAAEKSDQHFARPAVHQQDNYCFEMLSLLLALSGSQVGRSLLAQQTDLLADLLALLHTGSERVQRQVISLLRRIISEIPPQKMLAAINPGNEINERITLLDHLLCYLGKAITVQMKVKGSGASAPGSVMMGTSVVQGPNAAWFMKGETTKKHAHLVAKLLSDMGEEKVSPTWGLETRRALANYASQVAQISESDRRPERCIALPTMWMTLAALCVCEQAHIELLNGTEGRESRSREPGVESRPFCANHDDGATTAVIECHTCGALCAECDRFLHLNRTTRAHHRQICKEEESAIRIDIHEGCGRAKLFWLLLLVDRRTLKGLAEFRGMESGVGEAVETAVGVGAAGLAGVCRFCGTRGSSGLLAIGNVCSDLQCQEHGSTACNRLLPCGHLCGGVRGERSCLPCLLGCSGDPTLRQDADDMCMICFTDPLQAAPAIQLGCGHVFHLHCCKKVLSSKWIGPRITFSFSQCPICKEDMGHWTLEELLAPIKRLCEEVRRKALMRLEYEGLSAPGAGASNAQFDPAKYAMERYAYYVCHKCEKAYFGGLARCEAESNGVWEPSELVCGACSDVASAKSCPKHGADFLEYKCRYCCSVAVFFCFGTSHFCNSCHDDFQRVTNIPRHLLPQCPAGPKGEQLPGSADECPLHVSHPPTGEEFALGCGICRHAHVF